MSPRRAIAQPYLLSALLAFAAAVVLANDADAQGSDGGADIYINEAIYSQIQQKVTSESTFPGKGSTGGVFPGVGATDGIFPGKGGKLDVPLDTLVSNAGSSNLGTFSGGPGVQTPLAVPEPTTSALLVIGGALATLLARSRRRQHSH